ncbi:MAG: DNA-directed RNA polymerase [Candidatus Aenigmarchaeota archaeon]|nr:DNA-directed RNA polymerase [Candidatus Aenigmarchaeota archaeon]
MFKIIEVEDSVRVPPEKFDKDLEESIGESIQERFEGVFSSELGIVLNLESVEEVGEGKVVPEDGGVYYTARFKLLIYMPEEYEVTLGEVVDITEFGAFVRIGPVDAMTHISQIMNDYVSYDKKNSILVGRDNKNMLKEGDLVRARIISISFTKDNRIGLTMRQPSLGAMKWLEDKKKKEEEKKLQGKKEEKK